jgi:hypothetical protein
MGWSFEIRERSRKDFIESLTTNHFGPDYTPLESRVVGNHVWQLVKQESANRTFITLDLIAKERNGGWGYKGLSEDMGPYHYDCPLALLDKASEPINESAKEWRIKVREFHAKKSAKRKPTPGLVVKSGEREYELIEAWGPRRGWKVRDVTYGGYYRMPAAQLSRALT